MLETRGLTASYGQFRALFGVDLTLAAGETVAIIGANGAGKSTLLRAIAGICEGRVSGQVMLNGASLTALNSDQIVEQGVALVPEGRAIFSDLTVKENLLLGAYSARARADEAQNLERVLNLFPKLIERQTQIARTMSGGEQQMCAIGRGLMAKPKLLLIDELSLGLAPRAVEKLTDYLIAINKEGLSILLVEQDVMTAFDLSSYGVVIETGKVTLSGSTAYLSEEPRVREAYLGV